MKRAMLVAVLACAALLQVGRADVVTDWNAAAMDYLLAVGASNHMANRTMAMMHTAIFEAVNAIDRGAESLFDAPLGPAPRSAPLGVAASAAAYEVLVGLDPGSEGMFRPILEAYALDQGPAGTARVAQRLGHRAAGLVLALRADDGSAEAATVPYPDGTAPGEYRRTSMMPLVYPGWGQVTPWVIGTGDQFRGFGPPPLDSYEYARDYEEVKAIGAKLSTWRTAGQTATARFWPTGIPRMWNLAAQQVSATHGFTVVQNARLFALLNLAMADAQIAGWDMKYHFGFWRPSTAIAEGDDDTNDATVGDSAWEPLLMNPAFPEYVSGHSTTCAAAATVLAAVFGSDAQSFTLTSEANPSLPPRSFDSFWAAACEAGISRVYGGIHFNFSNVQGLEAGRWLGRYVVAHAMRPLRE